MPMARFGLAGTSEPYMFQMYMSRHGSLCPWWTPHDQMSSKTCKIGNPVGCGQNTAAELLQGNADQGSQLCCLNETLFSTTQLAQCSDRLTLGVALCLVLYCKQTLMLCMKHRTFDSLRTDGAAMHEPEGMRTHLSHLLVNVRFAAALPAGVHDGGVHIWRRRRGL